MKIHMPKHVATQYAQDIADRRVIVEHVEQYDTYIGCFVGRFDPDTKTVTVGWSACLFVDATDEHDEISDQYNKTTGRNIAYGRAFKRSHRKMHPKLDGYVEDFVERCLTYFKEATDVHVCGVKDKDRLLDIAEVVERTIEKREDEEEPAKPTRSKSTRLVAEKG